MFSLALLAGLLSACQTTPEPVAGVDAVRSWQARQQTLNAMQRWHLEGRIAIQAEKEGWHAALRWDRQDDTDDIRLSSPLGQDVVQLHADALGVTMRSSDGLERAADAESLLYKRLGWRIPVSGLRSWVLGLPDTNLPAPLQQDTSLDTLGRLSRLRQSGWDIDFRRYTRVGGIDLPNKIFLNNRQTGMQLEVRLVVETWEINPT